MQHPILQRIEKESFAPLGWFEAMPQDRLAADAKSVLLIGNAGPDMFIRFSRERNPGSDSLDEWTKATVDRLAQGIGAIPLYPFGAPVHPFLTWARRAGTSFVSPLGLNIHPTYGLWHAYRAALVFTSSLDLPNFSKAISPCDSCSEKPCLKTCPVSAFAKNNYDVKSCGLHILSDAGTSCMSHGCQARLACPIGKGYEYSVQQKQFHMKAFQQARAKELQ
jgi:hypothetical protein